jgi:hypothetical protein
VQREGYTAGDPALAAVTNGRDRRDVLELYLSDTRQLFSSVDPAPFREHSLVIGAWVALWRPLEIFLYDWWPVRAEARRYDRLGTMDVRLVDTSVAVSPDGAAP